MTAKAPRLCQAFLLTTSLIALLTCPHSKVEESFNLQASHDLFYHGLGPAWRGSFALDDNVGSSSSCAADVAPDGEGVDSCSAGEDGLPYDHIKFPGVVPRTFFGPFILSSIAKFISWVIPKQIYDLQSHPMAVQFLIRFELLLFSLMAHLRLANALGGFVRRHQMQSAQSTLSPTAISNYYLLITASQFHIPFYSSRLLPNTFALLAVTHAYAEWFSNKPRGSAICLVFATAVFRCDALILLFTIGLTMLIRRELSIIQAITTGIITGAASLLITVPLDSLLWRRPIWPEFEVLWFNTVDNRSSEWGTQVWHWYFSRALPKGLLLTAFLVPLAFLRLPERTSGWIRNDGTSQLKVKHSIGMFDTFLLQYFAPVIAFVMLYSWLPHKEIRFIFPALPMLNACAAVGMGRLHYVALSDRKGIENKSCNWICIGMYLCGIVAISCTLIGNIVFVRLSKENYPGGVALNRLKHHLEASVHSKEWNEIHVHIDVATAMTGVSLFGQRYASHRASKVEGEGLEGPFSIDKSGYEKENSMLGSLTTFTHLLTEESEVNGFHLVDVIQGNPSLDIRNFRMVTQDSILIFERNGWEPESR